MVSFGDIMMAVTHGWLQLTAWSKEVSDAVGDVARDLKAFCYKRVG
jgi:hypothetical protein